MEHKTAHFAPLHRTLRSEPTFEAQQLAKSPCCSNHKALSGSTYRWPWKTANKQLLIGNLERLIPHPQQQPTCILIEIFLIGSTRSSWKSLALSCLSWAMEMFYSKSFAKCKTTVCFCRLWSVPLIIWSSHLLSCPSYFERDSLNNDTADNWALAAGNLRKLLRMLDGYFTTVLKKQIDTSHVNVNNIGMFSRRLPLKLSCARLF